ncbi:CoA-binding domain-containing protein [Favolaschia claudopus]|uniref:CoA-binding domain-containing protein n=1 Tax=Favolaschia claudopus TaxID=2862362 RepID=A0AAW0DAK0_9AGAR
MATTKQTLYQKEVRFFGAPKFAVVGASANAEKNGSKALAYLRGKHNDVVPINPRASEIQGIKCLKTLSELPDPTHTAISIVVQPEVTLEILKQAQALKIFAIWIQPGAENDAVTKFIQSDPELEGRCVYDSHAIHDSVRNPSRSNSKPEPLSVSTNLPAAKVTGPVEATTPPCLWKDDPTALSMPVINTAVVAAVQTSPTLEQKEALFLSAPRFAVVGASTNEAKNGSKALKWLIQENKDVVPVNLTAAEIQGRHCMKTLNELPDPTHTSVSIVVPPKATLEVVKLAKSLNVYALWLQPGAEDDEVVKFIESDPQLKARCVYREHALHTTAGSTSSSPITDTSGPCIFLEPQTAKSVLSAPLVAANVVAGVKHAISPPSTPPVNKSLKLSPETDNSHILNLGDEVPGLA